MTVKITLEFSTMDEAIASLQLLKTPSGKLQVPAQVQVVDKPNKPAKPVEAAMTPPEPADPNGGAGEAPHAVAPAEMTEGELSRAIIAKVAVVGKDKVLGLLQTQFKVSSGKAIADPAVRAQAARAIAELS